MGVVNWLYTFSIFLYSVESTCFPYYYGFDPLANFLHQLIGGILFVALDFLVSDSASYNRKVLHLNGYNDLHLLFFFLSTVVIAYSGLYNSLSFYAQEIDFHFDFSFVFWVFFNMAMGEALFTFAHKQLHLHFPSLHYAHHCCLRSSYSTNFIFHPIDLMLEFSLPGVVPILTYHFLFQSNWVLVFTIFLQSTWYSMDHDESLKLPHFSHHKYIDSSYNIYIKTKDRSQKDLVRKMVKRPEVK
mmetsp:Transcript_28737/g.39765  ORF Transcript_28737/g.39765 Transcript_28737/m.39765 type:complete len:243 (+) Transcript_28737:87-815(+)